IRCRFDEIVAFADVERFIDTPVKRYSSGMYVRLAFSVAAHLEPDVLKIDRKSTRLNSSHVSISYAVFCLKKKKKKQDIKMTYNKKKHKRHVINIHNQNQTQTPPRIQE